MSDFIELPFNHLDKKNKNILFHLEIRFLFLVIAVTDFEIILGVSDFYNVEQHVYCDGSMRLSKAERFSKNSLMKFASFQFK